MRTIDLIFHGLPLSLEVQEYWQPADHYDPGCWVIERVYMGSAEIEHPSEELLEALMEAGRE